MKTTKLLIVLMLALIIGQFLTDKTDLEIYTNDDIYYIDGLTVTRENSPEGYIFTTKEDMKIFFAELTANNVKTH